MKIRKTSAVIIALLIFVLGAATGLGISNAIMPGSSISSVSGDQGRYDKVNELWGIIEKNYYIEPNEEDMKDGLARGLFIGLGDKYSAYMTKEEYEAYETSVTGEFDGIGVTFQMNKDGEFEVISTVKNSPAEKAGVKKGDIITKVDGKEYDDADKIGAAMRGKRGTKVKVTYERDGKENTVSITRAHIVTETVTSKMLGDNIGYIKISAFEEKTDADFESALSEMESKAARGVIIDLRDNGGGLVKSGVNIADKLLGKCVVTYMEDRKGDKEYYRSDSDCTQLPYVLLVNGNTASASEILSAAVKDKGRGKIVGTQTYGKGVVQVSGKLSDGSGYRLTIMQYFSPNGKAIHEKGVKPDYVVKGKDAQLKKAEELIKKGF
ncbi:MAG: S41 family peptidase [Firmicutes bacterium]|nr:S41 family peptidase [Bacillota bacterium]